MPANLSKFKPVLASTVWLFSRRKRVFEHLKRFFFQAKSRRLFGVGNSPRKHESVSDEQLGVNHHALMPETAKKLLVYVSPAAKLVCQNQRASESIPWPDAKKVFHIALAVVLLENHFICRKVESW